VSVSIVILHARLDDSASAPGLIPPAPYVSVHVDYVIAQLRADAQRAGVYTEDDTELRDMRLATRD
jgi:hypothetical protein